MNVGSVVVGVVATAAWWFGWLWPLTYVVVALLAALYTAQWNLVCGKLYQPPQPQPQITVTSVILQKMMVCLNAQVTIKGFSVCFCLYWGHISI